MSTLGSTARLEPGLQPAGASLSGLTAGTGQPTGHARPRPAARRVGWLLAAVAIALALSLAFAALLMSLDWSESVRVFVDGEPVFAGPPLEAMSFGELVAAALAIVLALIVSLVVVPLAVALGLAAAALGLVLAVVLGLGLPLLIVVGLGALLLSPLILAGWLLVKLLG